MVALPLAHANDPGRLGRGAAAATPAVNFAYARVPGTGVSAVGDRRFSIRYSHQIGVTLGIDRPISLGGMELERVGVGYQFGDGLDALRFNLGFPF